MNGVNLGIPAAGLIVLVDNWPSPNTMGGGGLHIHPATAQKPKPILLSPIGPGCITSNLSLFAITDPAEDGMLAIINGVGADNALLPPLISIGVGTMMNSRPSLASPLCACGPAAHHLAPPYAPAHNAGIACDQDGRFAAPHFEGRVDPLSYPYCYRCRRHSGVEGCAADRLSDDQ